MSPESLRETNLEATVTRFEFSWRIGRKSEWNIPTPGLLAHRPPFKRNLWKCAKKRLWKCPVRGKVFFKKGFLKRFVLLKWATEWAMEMLSKTLKMLPSRVPESKNFPAARPRENGHPSGSVDSAASGGATGGSVQRRARSTFSFSFPCILLFFSFSLLIWEEINLFSREMPTNE